MRIHDDPIDDLEEYINLVNPIMPSDEIEEQILKVNHIVQVDHYKQP